MYCLKIYNIVNVKAKLLACPACIVSYFLSIYVSQQMFKFYVSNKLLSKLFSKLYKMNGIKLEQEGEGGILSALYNSYCKSQTTNSDVVHQLNNKSSLVKLIVYSFLSLLRFTVYFCICSFVKHNNCTVIIAMFAALK